jgi:hypothetical protein
MLAPDPEPEQPAEPEQPLQEFSGAHLSLAPSAAGYRYPEWWAWLGGIIGSTALVGSVAIAPLISFTVATINSAGQLVSSLLVDHFGFLGIQRQRMSLRRAAGDRGMILLLGCVGASLESSAAFATTTPLLRLPAARWLWRLSKC